MQAIEFETQLEGKNIKLPESLKHILSTHAKVIVLFDEEPKKPSPEQEAFEKSGFAQQVLLSSSEDVWDRV